MAWKNPFGMPEETDPQKIEAAKAQSKAEMEAFTSNLRTTFDESIKPLREEFNALKSKVESFETPRRESVRTDPTEIPSVLDNEDAAFAARIGPLAIQTGLLNARMTESEVFSEISSKGWGHLIPQIREVLEKQTPVQTKVGQGYRGYVDNVAQMLIGREAVSKGLKFDGNKQTFFLEDASGGGNPQGNKLRALDQEANDGRIDILNGRSVADWAKNMGIKNPEALLEGGN